MTIFSSNASSSAAHGPQIQLMALAEPNRAVPMITQLIAGIGMHEHVERSVIEREPPDYAGQLRWRKADLVAPAWMRSDLSLVQPSHLHLVAEVRGQRFAKPPGRVAASGIE